MNKKFFCIINSLSSLLILGCSTVNFTSEYWIPDNIVWFSNLSEADSSINNKLSKIILEPASIIDEAEAHQNGENFYWSIDTVLEFRQNNFIAINLYILRQDKYDSLISIVDCNLCFDDRRIGTWKQSGKAISIITEEGYFSAIDGPWETVPNSIRKEKGLLELESKNVTSVYYNNRRYIPCLKTE